MHWDDVCPQVGPTKSWPECPWCLALLGIPLNILPWPFAGSPQLPQSGCFHLSGTGNQNGPVRKHHTCIQRAMWLTLVLTGFQIQNLPAVSTADNCDCNFTCQYLWSLWNNGTRQIFWRKAFLVLAVSSFSVLNYIEYVFMQMWKRLFTKAASTKQRMFREGHFMSGVVYIDKLFFEPHSTYFSPTSWGNQGLFPPAMSGPASGIHFRILFSYWNKPTVASRRSIPHSIAALLWDMWYRDWPDYLTYWH